MKKKIKIKKTLSLEKFKIAELKNPKTIVGGDCDGGGSGTGGGNKIPPTV